MLNQFYYYMREYTSGTLLFRISGVEEENFTFSQSSQLQFLHLFTSSLPSLNLLITKCSFFNIYQLIHYTMIKEINIQVIDDDQSQSVDSQFHQSQFNLFQQYIDVDKARHESYIYHNQSLNQSKLPSQLKQSQLSDMKKISNSENTKSSKQRKRRAKLNQQMIEEMNKAFNLLNQENGSPFKNVLTLRKIAENLNLSQVTVLRKYRQFKKNNIIACPKQYQSKNRSYKKTQQLHRIMEECIKYKKFSSASQLSNYIKEKYGKDFTRSQIRYFLKKIDPIKLQIAQKEKKNNLVYKNYSTFFQNNKSILFFGEVQYYTKDLTLINIALICGEKGLSFSMVVENFESNRHVLGYLLDSYFGEYGFIEKWMIVTGVHELDKHTRTQKNKNNQQSLLDWVVSKNGQVFCLPPEYETENLAKNILIRNSLELYKPEAFFYDQMTTKLQAEKNKFSLHEFLRFTNQLQNQEAQQQNQQYD